MQKSIVLLILCLFGVGGIYVYTLAPSVSPQGDSGELITMAALLGIAHPPGYPLYTLLGHLFSLIPVNSIAWRLNLFAAVSHLGALAFVGLTLHRLTKNWLMSIGTMLILAFSYTFWLYSLIAEVFSLNDLIISAIIFMAVCFYQSQQVKEKLRSLYGLAFLFGLGLSNHHSVLLLGPAIVFLITPLLLNLWRKTTVKEKLRFFVLSFLLFAFGLSSYGYILWRAKTVILPVSWSYPNDWASMLGMFFRVDYGTTVPFQGAQPALATLAQKLDQVVTYLRFVWDDFSALGFVLFGLGMVAGIVKKSRLAVFLMLSFLTNIFFLSYANFPINESSGTTLAVTERFYLLGNIFFVLILGLGINFLHTSFLKVKVLRFLILPMLFLFTISLFLRNFDLVSQRDNFLGFNLGKNVLATAPKGSLIIPGGDVMVFTTMYVRYVEKFRPDVEIWTGNQAGPKNNYRFLRRARPDLDFSMPEAVSMAGVVRLNYLKAPVLMTDQPNFLLPGLVASPSALFFYFQKTDSLESFSDWHKRIDENVGQYVFPADQSYLVSGTIGDRVVTGAYQNMFTILGDFCRLNRQWPCAVDFYQKALEFDPNVSTTKIHLARVYDETHQCDLAEKQLLGVLNNNSQLVFVYKELAGLAKDCFSDKTKETQYLELFEQKIKTKESDLKKL